MTGYRGSIHVTVDYPPRDAGPDIPRWTPIATMIRRSAKRPADWIPVENAPIGVVDATRLREQGLLLMAQRRDGALTVLVVKSPDMWHKARL
jgi:hypothetical protein